MACVVTKEQLKDSPEQSAITGSKGNLWTRCRYSATALILGWAQGAMRANK